jgi:hypothetical protein
MQDGCGELCIQASLNTCEELDGGVTGHAATPLLNANNSEETV